MPARIGGEPVEPVVLGSWRGATAKVLNVADEWLCSATFQGCCRGQPIKTCCTARTCRSRLRDNAYTTVRCALSSWTHTSQSPAAMVTI